MNNPSVLGRREFLIASLAGAAGAALDTKSPGPEPQAVEAPLATAAKKIRYGVVGTGARSVSGHLPILKKFVPEAEVVALCDITPQALEKAHAILPNAATYDDHQRMLAEQKDLDAVLVVVPNYVHADITVHALEAGKHVLVEKPMATSLLDADRMIHAARKNRLVLQIGMQNRFAQGYVHMASMIRDGAIGDLEYIAGQKFRGDWNPQSWQYTDPVTGEKTNWRFLTKTAGSALLEDGIHDLDIVHMLAGSQPTRVQAQGGNAVFRDRETIDNAGLLVEFANGAHLTFSYTVFTVTRVNPVAMRIFGSKAEMWLETLHEDSPRGDTQIVVTPYRGQPERIPVATFRPEEQDWKEARPFDVNCAREHKAFIQSITTGAPVAVDGQAGRDAIHLSLAAERSLRTGGRVLRWDEEASL